jgi:predicted cupin superfamily sugar epimerase
MIALLNMSDHDRITINKIIKALDLVPLPREGGYYTESFRSTMMIPKELLSSGYKGARPASTAIYFLLTNTAFSAMHRLPATEIFHLYMGGPVETTLLFDDGSGEVVTIGREIEFGERPQLIVPGGVWQGSRLAPNNDGFALMGTTISPGFEFEDYEHGIRDALIESHPAFADEISRLTR